MPALLLSCLGSKYTWYALALMGLVAGFFIYRAHLIGEGEAKCEAAVEAATVAEQQREQKANSDWQQWADSAVQGEVQQKAKIDALEQQIATASAANDKKPGLDAAAVGRLRALGGSGKAAPVAAAKHPRR